MPPRKATKIAAGEVVEKVVEADLPRPKRKKAPAKTAIEEGEEMKQVRLPRAAKANRTQEIDNKNADANGDADKKPSARADGVNSKKAASAAKQTSKRGKGDAEMPPNAEDEKNDAEVPVKKSRAKVPAKKAGMVAGDEPKGKQKGKPKKNVATDNTNHADAPPAKKGRGTGKNEALEKNKDIDKVEDETETTQKKGRTQKKPAAKPAAKKSRVKKDAAEKDPEEKMDSEEDEEAGGSMENGDKENEKANLEETESVPVAKKGKAVRKKVDNVVQKKVTKPRGKAVPASAAAATTTASGNSSEENVEDTAPAKPIKGRAKKMTKDTAAVTGKKMQRKKVSAKTEAETAENDEESEETAVEEEKEDVEDIETTTEIRHLSSENSDSKLQEQESENDETKERETDSDKRKSPLTDKNENEW